MTKVPTICCVGSALQDIFLSDRRDFATIHLGKETYFKNLELGAKVDIEGLHFDTGGGATNAAVTFARQGLKSSLLGCIGRDPAGEAILKTLDEEGVDTSAVKFSSHNTGTSVALLAATGERTLLIHRGASFHYDEIKPQDLDPIAPDWLYVTTFSGQMEKLSSIFSHAKKLGAKIMFNPGSLELKNKKKLLSLLEDVDIILLNREEASQLVPGTTLDELVSHLQSTVPLAIVTDGDNGLILSDGETKIRAGIYEDVRSIDRTGAGDAFGSGFLAFYAQGRPLVSSILFASANSTSVIQYLGAKQGILQKGTRLHEMPLTETKL